VRRRTPIALLASCLALLAARDARAFDIPKVEIGKAPIRVDVTEVSTMGWRFKPRTAEGQAPADGGWGFWINRLNVALNWKKWTLGVRLDSAVYWDRPNDACNDPSRAAECRVKFADYSSRWRDSIYPAKLWLTYTSKNLEVTVGDAYAQLGRGLVLSMRKIDDLGIDNTVRGVKVQITQDPIAFTGIAGLANPSRVDEPSGRAMFVPATASQTSTDAQGRPFPNPSYDSRAPQPIFGSDRIVAAEIQAGRGSPIVLASHVMMLTRCAPYSYNKTGPNAGSITGDFASELGIGTCNGPDVDIWLADQSGVRKAREFIVIGQSVELPKLPGKLGTLYVGVAMQKRSDPDIAVLSEKQGNALYASYSGTIGPVTNTFELKSYRNYYNAAGTVLDRRAPEFSNVAYTAAPTAEAITQDAMFGDFNACVDGGRLRTDVRLNKNLMVWGQAFYAHTKSELSRRCNEWGRILASTEPEETLQNDIWDGTGGIQWDFDKNRSFLYAQAGVRGDRKRSGDWYYRDHQFRYAFSKWLGGSFTFELTGLHRIRWEEDQNRRGPGGQEQAWLEGENYAAIKVAPKWIFSQGFEYLTRLGFPTYYVNGGLTYKFTKDSNLKMLVGQQRGGLRCVNGVCRIFPAFEGARIELTVRF
jgi:hypothetical protein